MDKERTKEMMKYGYILNMRLNIWNGFLAPTTTDLGLDMTKTSMSLPGIRVMSKDWVKAVKLLQGSARRSQLFIYTPPIKFEGGSHRYLLKGLRARFVREADKIADRFQEYYMDIYTHEAMHRKRAKHTIKANIQIYWDIYKYNLKGKKLPPKAPAAWANEVADNMIREHFPTLDRMKLMGLSYTITTPGDTEIMGKHQRPHPGAMLNTFYLGRLIEAAPTEFRRRMEANRKTLSTVYKKTGVYSLALGRITNEIERYRGLTPLPIDTFGMGDALDELETFILDLDVKEFRANKAKKDTIFPLIDKLFEILDGPYLEARQEAHKKLYSAPWS